MVVNSYFEGKTHQIQLISTPKLQFFFWKTNLLTNYNLSPIITFIIYYIYIQRFPFLPHSYFQFFLYLLLAKHT